MKNESGVYDLAIELGRVLNQRNLRCAVAESCTGGALAAAITDIAGSSQWFDRGFITYSNESKQQMLGVAEQLIAINGAVSESVVREMAEGALKYSAADVSISISGVAGPGGGSPGKPVGTVWIAWAGTLQPTIARCFVFAGDRLAIRLQAVTMALEGLIQRYTEGE